MRQLSLESSPFKERMVPEETDVVTFWEHIYRYRFASRFVRNQRVLDIACGGGYGSAALREAGAKYVLGTDISVEACVATHQKYDLPIVQANAEKIPLKKESFDLVVSFETIEHLNNPLQFLDECARILVSKGLLIISTPNGGEEKKSPKNPYHFFEWSRDEFLTALQSRFNKIELFTQVPYTVGWWSPRSLAASNTPWIRARGFYRIRNLVREFTCPPIFRSLNTKDRYSAVSTILLRDSAFASLVNPYMVKKWSTFHKEHPRYWVAVAHK